VPNMERRTFLGAAMASLPLAFMGQSIETSTPFEPSNFGEPQESSSRLFSVY